ncbi:hypothetical protein WN943_009968 [Citrus x changshan-huyou]
MGTVVHTWGLHLKGPVRIEIFKALSIAIAATMSFIFLGYALHPGRKEAEARAEELKKSKQVTMPMNNVKKQGGQLQKSGFERGSKRSGGGSANDDGDS